MPRADYKHCRECGRHVDECGPLSHTRLCADDANRLLANNVIGLATRSGEPWRKWRTGMAACVGGVILKRGEKVV